MVTRRFHLARVAVLVAMTLAEIAVSGPVVAAPRCADLVQVETAILRQQAALAGTNRQIRRGGCLGGLFAGAPHPQCGDLESAAASMQANLVTLDARKRRAEAACGVQAAMHAPPARQPAADRNVGLDAGVGSAGFGAGSYRTLCVRACDGYYFPISERAGRGRFAKDENQCRATCPRADVGLFVHRAGGDSADAVSLDGRRYRDLPTAFAYRKAFNPACGCDAQGTATGGPFVPAPGLSAMPVAAPPALVDVTAAAPATDPSDDALFATRRLDLDLGPLPAPEAAAPAAPAADAEALNRPVRIVGPTYLPAR
ncbi:DUF2865 domain-containing protein [Methylobrevis albus]|uniref:DUF2865 domain-containing protein n=1 Tax=Methylobrevis albus TaxID=2793297 RepID=A0A931I2F2_9HYPH|nr:DUF2865 domain-containing protein [Methylobrevis albus]MBH0238997.1 DUF2865 domain-containing protein [Methylobrevis albus]